MRAENDIYIGKFFMKIFRFSHLLSHAAAHSNNHIAPDALQLFKHPDISERMIFRILPDAAGVKHHDIGFFGRTAIFIAQLRQYARYLLRLVHVHLAAVGYDIKIFIHVAPFELLYNF